jgi:hypothetical protein
MALSQEQAAMTMSATASQLRRELGENRTEALMTTLPIQWLPGMVGSRYGSV